MKNILCFTALLFMLNVQTQAQSDSIHVQIQDTILKKGDTYILHTQFKENISAAQGLQLFIKFDQNYLKYEGQELVYLSPEVNTNEDFANEGYYILIWVPVEPYHEKGLVDLKFTALEGCRIKDVFKVLPKYQRNPNTSAQTSEMYFEQSTLPLTNEYLPFNDGISTFKVNFSVKKAKIFPTICRETSIMEFLSEKSEKTNLIFYDVYGNKTYSKEIHVKSGKNIITLKRSEFGATGFYFLSIQIGSNQITGMIQITD